MLETLCSGCGRALRVSPENAGKMARCPVCSHITAIPPLPAPEAQDACDPPGDQWFMRTPEGQTFGPTARVDLERWVKEGRVTGDCQLGSSGRWQTADVLFPALRLAASGPPAIAGHAAPAREPEQPGYTVPHRGPLILVLALLGICVVCPVFPFMAWVMGSNDLREIQAGRMDRQGRDVTRAGMVVGMVLSILWIVGFLIVFGIFFIHAATGS